MKQRIVYPENARNLEYEKLLKAIEKSGLCPFCPGGHTLTDPEEVEFIFHRSEHWVLKHNRYPLEGARIHVVLIPKLHRERSQDLRSYEMKDLWDLYDWLDRQFDAQGRFTYTREGDASLTGATVAHIHTQYIIPEKGKVVEVRFGSSLDNN